MPSGSIYLISENDFFHLAAKGANPDRQSLFGSDLLQLFSFSFLGEAAPGLQGLLIEEF